MFSRSSLLDLVSAAWTKRPPPPEMRQTLDELRALPEGESAAGSSLLPAVQTKVLFGDPTHAGLYSILLVVAPNTTIQSHSHRDDRVATVLTGTWRFGYGNKFDAVSLKELPPGSVYTEPGHLNHFAQTGDEPVIVQITGIGPTDTRYVQPENEPKPH